MSKARHSTGTTNHDNTMYSVSAPGHALLHSAYLNCDSAKAVPHDLQAS